MNIFNILSVRNFTAHNIFIFLFGFLVVFRLPENYSLQPAYLLYLLIPLFAFFISKRNFSKINLYIILLFYIYFFLVNFVYYLKSDIYDGKFLNALYWPLAYSLIFSLCIIRNNSFRLLIQAITFWLVLSIALAIVQFVIDFPIRGYGGSGSPNNLALSIIHIVVIRKVLNMPSFHYLFLILGAVNLSRSYIVFLFLHLARNYYKFLIFFVILILTLYEYSASIGLGDLISFLENRFIFSGNSTDESGRGLARVLLYPEFLFLGAGDLNYSYHGDYFFGQVHNNFLAIWFSFGIPGLLFAVLFLTKLFKYAGWYLGLIYLAFSFSHYFYNNIFFVILTASLVIAAIGSKKPIRQP
jgi:hypothetical protein